MTLAPKSSAAFLGGLLLVLLGYEWQQQQRAKQAAFVAEGLALGSQLKVQVAEYFYERGEFPAANADLQLPAPEAIHGQSLKSLTIAEGGVIRLQYDEKSGRNGGEVLLWPDTSLGSLGLQWHCEAPSYRHLRKWLPQCLTQ